MTKIKIGDKFIGEGEKLYFVADIGANHDGDINRAFKLIELAKNSGADAAKFQNFRASKIVSRKGFDSLGTKLSHQSKWKKSVYDVYKEASLPFDWTAQLKKKCDEVGIDYFTSAYDFKTIDSVDPYVDVYKIGSGDITWHEIIEYIASKGKPVMISTGASNLQEVKMAMNILQNKTDDIVLMQCNTNYTANSENFKYINLNVLKTYRKLYPDVILGLSDHTYGYSTVLGAIVLGAKVIEKHFTDDNEREGPDHKFAMNPKSWKEMVKRSNELYLALGDGIKRVEENEKDTAILQRRALRWARDIKENNIIAESDIIALRPIPENGIPPYRKNDILGKRITRDVFSDELVKWEDVKDDQR